MERTHDTQAIETTVTPLSARRVRVQLAERPVEAERVGGRMWINGRELGGAARRFEHLEGPAG